MGFDPIDPGSAIAATLDSISATELLVSLEDEFDRELPMSLFAEHASYHELAHALDQIIRCPSGP